MRRACTRRMCPRTGRWLVAATVRPCISTIVRLDVASESVTRDILARNRFELGQGRLTRQLRDPRGMPPPGWLVSPPGPRSLVERAPAPGESATLKPLSITEGNGSAPDLALLEVVGVDPGGPQVVRLGRLADPEPAAVLFVDQVPVRAGGHWRSSPEAARTVSSSRTVLIQACCASSREPRPDQAWWAD